LLLLLVVTLAALTFLTKMQQRVVIVPSLLCLQNPNG
jgi:hypothetical protein